MFLLAELAVAVAGWGLEINPFDQPNVQQAKDATNRVLAEYEPQRRAARSSPHADDGALRELLLGAAPAALRRDHGLRCSRAASSTPPSPSCARRSAHATRATTTFGYGPRFLHSTGQFHKGGPPTGRFLQVLHDGPRRRRDPRRALRLRHARGTRRRSATCRRCASSGCPAERVRLDGEDLMRRAARPDQPRSRRGVTQIGFVGLGKMGGNMVHRIRRDSDHEVVAFDFDEKAVKQAVQERRARRLLAGASSSSKLEPPRIVWIMVPAGDADPADGGQAREAARPRRHDRRRRQLAAGPTTSAARRR